MTTEATGYADVWRFINPVTRTANMINITSLYAERSGLNTWILDEELWFSVQYGDFIGCHMPSNETNKLFEYMYGTDDYVTEGYSSLDDLSVYSSTCYYGSSWIQGSSYTLDLASGVATRKTVALRPHMIPG